MKIGPKTKISQLLKKDEKMLDLIMQIHPKFSKLSNPLLRKALAPRVTVSDAAKIAGIPVRDFLKQLENAGFEVEYPSETDEIPYVTECNLTNRLKPVTIDARKMLEQNIDPFDTIHQALKNLKSDETLEIILDFIPAPLIEIFGKQGYKHCILKKNDLYYTYFYQEPESGGFWKKIMSLFHKKSGTIPKNREEKKDFEQILKKFEKQLETIDVRNLEMPQPMMRILEVLKNLPEDKALFVEHKRIPQFLIPELEKKGYQWVSRKISEDHTQLIIYKKPLSND